MKKIITTSLLATIILSLGSVNSFAAYEQEGGTDLDIVNDSDWLLHIPANQTITAATTDIGEVYISGTIEPTQRVDVSISNEGSFKRKYHSDVLPFELLEEDTAVETIQFTEDNVTEETKHTLTVEIDSEDFASTKAGTYETVITFGANLQDIPW